MSERIQYQFRDNNVIDKNDLLLNASLSEATTKEELIILKRCKEVINTLKKDEKDLNEIYRKIYDLEHNSVDNNNGDELLELKKQYNKIKLDIRHNERILNSLREMRFIKRIESSENINYLKSQGYNTERFEKKPDNSESSHISNKIPYKYRCIYCHKTMTVHEALDVDGETLCKRCYYKKWWLYVLFCFIDFLLFGVIPIVAFALGYSFVAVASIIAFIIFSIFIKSILNSIMIRTKEYRPKEKATKEIAPKPDKGTQKTVIKRYCKLCGELIDNDTQKCTNCGKQYFNLNLMKNLFINKKKVFIVTSASIAIVLSITLCFFAFNGKKHSGNIVITSQSKIVDAGDTAYVSIHGEPKTEYEITVTYNSGASTAKGLHSKTTDSLGYASWRWEVGTRTAPGEYTIRVEDDKEYNTTTFIVE